MPEANDPYEGPPDGRWADGGDDDRGRHASVRRLTDALRLFSVESDLFVDVFARAHGLGRNDLNAIMWIAEGTAKGDPVTAGELSARLGLGAPAVTALIDRLEGSGHIQRARDLRDRRKVAVQMQDQALELAQAFFRPLGVRMGAALEGVSSADLERCAEIVELLTGSVNGARRGVPDA